MPVKTYSLSLLVQVPSVLECPEESRRDAARFDILDRIFEAVGSSSFVTISMKDRFRIEVEMEAISESLAIRTVLVEVFHALPGANLYEITSKPVTEPLYERR